MTADISRREFLVRTAIIGAGAAMASTGISGRTFAGSRPDFYQPEVDLAIAKGGSPAKNCLAAVRALGGFEKFVRKGDRVAIKPNPVGTSPPERAINTHPEMLEAVVRECLRAGAREVIVLSHDELRSFAGNGTSAAVERAGGVVKALAEREQFREIAVPRGRILRTVGIASDILDADLFINMPIAKHHAGTRVTFSMKNLMGINWDRNIFHQTDLHQCIAELTSAVKQDLIIMDANHVLLTNGPVGPGQVLNAQQVIAGVDPVAIDAYATRFFGLEPQTIPHIRMAYELGVGEVDLAKLKVREFDA